MVLPANHTLDDFDPRFKIFHELMQTKVSEILLVSTLYDACIMEVDGQLAERITHEYRGLNLSKPPRLTWASSAEEALRWLERKSFDMVITMLRLSDMDAYALGEKLKEKNPALPVFLFTYTPSDPLTERGLKRSGIDRTFVWTGSSDLLLTVIKSVEDRLNVDHDTEVAKVRVILFVEDSPIYLSKLLPILYKEVICQTQAVMEHGLNEEHKLLTMRARPKILLAQNFEEATSLYERYKPYLLSVISDVRFPRASKLDENAGVTLLTRIKREKPDIPLLLTSSEASNAGKAARIPATFLDKNSPSLETEVRLFLIEHLGFGDFVFRMPDGREIARVTDMRSLEKMLPSIPDEAFCYHWNRNDFSGWLFARSEIILASKMRPVTDHDFAYDVDRMRRFIIFIMHERRKRRQKGQVVSLDAGSFDPDTDFLKIGAGSLGGKARGLVFIANMLSRHPDLEEKFPGVRITFPQTLVVTTECFDSFLEINGLKGLSDTDLSDAEIGELFLKGRFPVWCEEKLALYLAHITYPIAVRSSSLLEDSLLEPFAGLYRTYMLPNNHRDPGTRLEQLIVAIKLIYASTYFEGPRAFARRAPQHTGDEKMGIIIQRLIGKQYGDYFYPAVSGVAQSHNYYPIPPMKTEEGIAHIAMGLGKIVVEGGKVLRFSPKYPQALPQFSTVDDILKNAQRHFYALRMDDPAITPDINEDSTLEKRETADAEADGPIRFLSATYVPEEHTIRDSGWSPGPRVITFSQILKYKSLPLPEILSEILTLGQEGLACPVEIEFSMNTCMAEKECMPEFAFLQIRPMAGHESFTETIISTADISQAFCYSSRALGHGKKADLADIVFVKPDGFEASRTPEIAREIGRMNAKLSKEGRKYLLVGPGRWGSADRWLGIPVGWADISGVGAIVETTAPELKVEPSQGSHFFQNITSLGIDYLVVSDTAPDFLDWNWLRSQPVADELTHVARVKFDEPFMLKSDGRSSRSVIIHNAFHDQGETVEQESG